MHVSNKARPAGLAWAGTARSADAIAQPEWRLPSPAGVCACSECCHSTQLVVLGAARSTRAPSAARSARRARATSGTTWRAGCAWPAL